jgi:hypothetical protein
VPKLPATQGKRKRAQVEQEEGLPTSEPRAIRRRMDGANVINHPGNEQIHRSAPDIDHQDIPKQTITPAPNELNMDQDKENFGCVLPSTFVRSFSQWRSSLPDWITFITPPLRAGENVITLSRDDYLVLDIILEHLPRKPPAGCSGIKVPATASVENCADTTGKTLFDFRIHLYGATTQRFYESVCASCQKREEKWKETPDLIDYKTESDMIESRDGKIRVEFVICCYPKDHRLGDTEYL